MSKCDTTAYTSRSVVWCVVIRFGVSALSGCIHTKLTLRQKWAGLYSTCAGKGLSRDYQKRTLT